MLSASRPRWVTFDCYGTLIQWDEGLRAAVAKILAGRAEAIAPERLIATYDHYEHAIEQREPHRRFSDIASEALRRALKDLGAEARPDDAAILTGAIGRMPPFPEVVPVLEELKRADFKLCIISNTDDDVIAGNVAQLGGYIDHVITAQQAGAYKPAHRIFDYAHSTLGVSRHDVVHVCASPHLDLVATRGLGLRDVWIDRGTGRRPSDGYAPAATLPDLRGLPDLFRAADWL